MSEPERLNPEIKQVQRIGSYGFITAEGHVLLSLLNRGPNAGKWGLIGGGVEFKESPKEAFLREAFEEAGIRIDVEPVLIDVTSHDYSFTMPDGSQKHMHFISIIHRVELPKMLPCKPDGDGFSSDGTAWFPLDSLDLQALHPAVLRLLKASGD